MTYHHLGVARLRMLNSSDHIARIVYGSWLLDCALGPSGVRANKQEGDGATPAGLLRVRQVLYRSDRVRRPLTPHVVRPLRPSDGWCDAVGDRNYNRPVPHPYPASAEALWRQDGLYDVLVVLGYNDLPRVQGRGSCIFMHIARPGLAPTEGCIALALNDLMRLLEARQPLHVLDTRPVA